MTLTDKILGVETTSAIKAPCLVATTGNITLSGLQTIDGVALAEGDRVLVWMQTDPVENGIYSADSGLWERTVDFDGARDIRDGTLVYVAQGTAYSGKMFVMTSDEPEIDTDDIVFIVINGFTSGSMETFTDDARAITSADNAKILRWAGGVGEDATVELSASAPAGTLVFLLRSDDGELKTTPAAGATRRCRLDEVGFLHNGIDLPGGLMYALVETNTTGSAAAWLIGGDTAIVA